MGTFWAIVIAAVFLVALVGLFGLGGRYLSKERHAGERKGEIDSSRRDDQTRRSRRSESSGRTSSDSSGVHVYRH